MKSSKPKKQRIMQKEAPLHLKRKMMGCHLSEELQKKHNKKSISAIKGDKVKVMSGQFKGKTGNIEKIDTKKLKVVVSGVEIQKKDGTKIRMPIHISNVMIIELKLDDKKRQEILKRK
jgi:large subunit ribosomal protein L24